METEFVLSLGEQQWTLPAGTDTITIGRASNADIRLQADDQISRIHARLDRDGSTWTLYDESRNGTGLNGRRLTSPTPLTTGDKIHIGRSVLTFTKSSTPSPRTDPTPPPAPPSSAAVPPAASAAEAPAGPPSSASPAAAPPSAASSWPEAEPASPDEYGATTPPPPPPAASSPDRANHAPAGYPPADHGPADQSPVDHAPADHAPTDHAQAAPHPADRTQADYAPAAQPRVDQSRGEASPFAPAQHAPDAGQYPQVGDSHPDHSPFAPAADQGRTDGNPFASERAEDAEEYGADGNPFAQQRPDDAEEYGAVGNPFARERGDEAGEYGAAGVVPGFERSGDGGTWAAYPSADSAEPVRSPWEVSGQIDHAEPNWNESASWPDPTPAAADRRTTPDARTGPDPRTGADPRAGTDQQTGTDRRAGADRRSASRDRRAAGADRRSTTPRPSTEGHGANGYGTEQPSRRSTEQTARAQRLPATDRSTEADAVGTVRLARVLIAAGGVILLGIIVNLIVTFLADGPDGALRWLVPPGIALVVAMVLALLDAATPTTRRQGRLDVPVLVAIAVVLVGVGVGGFALTAGAEYVGGYLTGNESGEDRLIKPVAKAGSGITLTVENVTYTSHFTRVEVKLTSTAKEAVKIPIDGTTFTAADGTALRADPGKSSWPSRIAAGGTEHGTILFKGNLPDSADAAVLTFKSGNTTFAVPVALSH
ncbi:FHA domain-containing protein [Kribbella sp. NPDC003505]|uniref:FHA domain-containing protein n=1 Tax=Kribbella sp. NPDC003505 TaxID=3154448 RepID=UPI0033A85EA5